MAQETEQTCTYVTDYFPGTSDDLVEEVRGRLRLRLTGMACRLVSSEGEPSVDLSSCKGSKSALLRSVPVAFREQADSVRSAIQADVKHLKNLSATKVTQLNAGRKQVADALGNLRKALGTITVPPELQETRARINASVAGLVAIVEGLDQRFLEDDLLKDKLRAVDKRQAELSIAITAVHDKIAGSAKALNGLNKGCQNRTACARALVQELALLSSDQGSNGITANLRKAIDSASAISQLLGDSLGDMRIDPYWQTLPEAGIAGIEGLERTIDEAGIQLVVALSDSVEREAVRQNLKVLREAVSALGQDFTPPALELKSPEARRRFLVYARMAVETLRRGFATNSQLAAGEVPRVIDELFSVPLHYQIADRGLALTERALAPADRLLERLDDRFYFVGSIALVWNETLVQEQFDQFFEELRVSSLVHPRLQLAFAAAACRRLDEGATSSQFAPFLHRTVVGSMPRGLCQTAADEVWSSQRAADSKRESLTSIETACKAYGIAPRYLNGKLVFDPSSSVVSHK